MRPEPLFVAAISMSMTTHNLAVLYHAALCSKARVLF